MKTRITFIGGPGDGNSGVYDLQRAEPFETTLYGIKIEDPKTTYHLMGVGTDKDGVREWKYRAGERESKDNITMPTLTKTATVHESRE